MHEVESIYSPDGNVQFILLLSELRLEYAVRFKGKPVMEESPIGIVLDGRNLTEGVEVGQVSSYQVKAAYPWRGVHSQAINHCNGMTISLKHKGGNTSYALEIRAFDDEIP